MRCALALLVTAACLPAGERPRRAAVAIPVDAPSPLADAARPGCTEEPPAPRRRREARHDALVVWRRTRPGTAVIHGDKLWMWTGDRTLATAIGVALDDGAEVDRIDVGDESGKLLGFGLWPIPVGDGLWVGATFDPSGVSALSARARRPLWHTRLDSRPDRFSSADGHILLAQSEEVHVYDLLGELAWRATLPSGFEAGALALRSAGCAIVTGEQLEEGPEGKSKHMAVHAIEQHGTRWSMDWARWGHVEIGPTHVVMVQSELLAIVDTANGRLREVTLVEPLGYPTLALAGDTVVVASPLGGIASGVVEAYSLASGAQLWRVEASIRHNPSLAIVADTVLVESQGEVLLAFDLASGKPRWEWGAGRQFTLVGADDRAVLIDGDDLVAVDPHGTPTPLERVTVDGRVVDTRCSDLANDTIVVNDVVTTTGAQGAFRVQLPARGTLRIWSPGSVAADTTIPLTGQGLYTAQVSLDFCEYD
jgi:outer membrane protein assembly factor BamB